MKLIFITLLLFIAINCRAAEADDIRRGIYDSFAHIEFLSELTHEDTFKNFARDVNDKDRIQAVISQSRSHAKRHLFLGVSAFCAALGCAFLARHEYLCNPTQTRYCLPETSPILGATSLYCMLCFNNNILPALMLYEQSLRVEKHFKDLTKNADQFRN